MVDGNDLIPADSGWALQDATGINDAGEIVGDGVIDGQDHAFLLTPIPEPSVIWLLSVLVCWRGRRHRKPSRVERVKGYGFIAATHAPLPK